MKIYKTAINALVTQEIRFVFIISFSLFPNQRKLLNAIRIKNK